MFWKAGARKTLAASLYGEVTPEEQTRLDAALAEDTQLREEAAQWAQLVQKLPKDAPALEIDLLPLVQSRLHKPQRVVFVPRRLRWVGAMAAGLAICAGLAWYARPAVVKSRVAEVVSAPESRDAVPAVVAQAQGLIAQRDYTGAYRALYNAVEANPSAPEAAAAQALLAQVAFDDLRWYPEADKAYEKYMRDYPAAYEASPERKAVWERHELLTEAARVNYASLMELDAATQARADALPRYERVMARYPQTLAASLAARGCAKTILSEQGGGGTLVAAMRQARDRCKDPIAVAQLNLEMGHIYADDLQDPATARALYEAAAKAPELASLAAASLEKVGH